MSLRYKYYIADILELDVHFDQKHHGQKLLQAKLFTKISQTVLLTFYDDNLLSCVVFRLEKINHYMPLILLDYAKTINKDQAIIIFIPLVT